MYSLFRSSPPKVVYAAKSFLHATLHVLELTHRDENKTASSNRGSSYQPFGSVRPHTPTSLGVKPLTISLQPIPIPRDAHDAIFLSEKVAICALKAIHIVKPIK